jgi:O-methyltransferase
MKIAIRKTAFRFFKLVQRILLNHNIALSFSLHYMKRERNLTRLFGNDRFIGSTFDYYRISCLELLAYELNKRDVKGNIAELGVYKGELSCIINGYFPNRLLYLFDTFEGFDQRDILVELDKNFSENKYDFSDTRSEDILQKMPFPKNCIIKKGYFPDTTAEINDVFAFVSIDVDLFRPTIEGLLYFYPKMSPGGVILIHDYYNEKRFLGVQKAVDEFCYMNDLFFFPLSDSCGSVALIKQ